MAKIMKYGEKLGEHLVESKDSFETYKESYQSVRDIVSGFFREIREGVDREEENAMHKITEAYQYSILLCSQVEDKFSDKIKTTAYSVETLNSLADQLVTYEHLNESTFLESHSEREELYASFNQVNEEPVKHSTLGFSKKATVDALSKTFQAMVVEKVEKKGPGIAGSSYSSISNQIKKANDSSVGLKAAVRKVPITPPINNKKKMSIKK